MQIFIFLPLKVNDNQNTYPIRGGGGDIICSPCL